MSPYHLLIELPPTPKKHISRETTSVLEKLLENINQLLPVLIWNQVKSLCTLQRGTYMAFHASRDFLGGLRMFNVTVS